jgi:uncharacterized RDD family membrane protein YckC
VKERAGFGIRLAAAAIDVILLGILSIMVGMFSGGLITLLVHQSGLTRYFADPAGAVVFSGFLGVLAAILMGCLVASLLSLPYNLMEAIGGWTPGKLAMGLRVRQADGSPASFGQIFARWLVKHNSVLLFLLTFLGIPAMVLSGPGQMLIWVGCFLVLTPQRQALHDMASGTAVFEANQFD